MKRKFIFYWSLIILISQQLNAAVISKISLDSKSVTIYWRGATSEIYKIENSVNLSTGDWETIIFLTSKNESASYKNSTSDNGDVGFYQSLNFTNKVPAGNHLITYVPSSETGDIAVLLYVPETARYTNGAGVVIMINTFFTDAKNFQDEPDFSKLGLIQLSYLWPGKNDVSTAASDGTYDYGGSNCISALRDVINFALGEIPNSGGRFLHELIEINPLYDNVGLYAFSHPGIAAVNVLDIYADELSNVSYLVGRENPTLDKLSCVELGWYDDDDNGNPVFNPLYSYPACYSPTNIFIDYSTVKWEWQEEIPYFDLNSNGVADAGDHKLGTRIPTMFNKNFYSCDLLTALADNGALTNSDWPVILAKPQMADDIWPFRESVFRYPAFSALTNKLRVLLLFAQEDHVQPAIDKPHIHQAYDGFRFAAKLWTRLNPDKEYMNWASHQLGNVSADNPANTQPADWSAISNWAYGDVSRASYFAASAAVAEMSDRAFFNNWTENLTNVLVTNPKP